MLSDIIGRPCVEVFIFDRYLEPLIEGNSIIEVKQAEIFDNYLWFQLGLFL